MLLGWWGYASAADRARLEAFLHRSVRLGFRSASAPTLTSVCALADDRLFAKIINDSRHLLRSILPPARVEHYHLRKRPHNFKLPIKSSSFGDRGFIMRMMYKDTGYRAGY